MSIRQPARDNRQVKTLRLPVDPGHLDHADARQAIARAADLLRCGKLVALPTETVYGLGANALDAAAVARIFEAKQRPSWDPIIVHIAGPVTNNPMPGTSMLDEPMLAALVVDVPQAARKLMQAFWPGPLTLLLPRSAAVPDIVTAGRSLVGIRMPAHPVAFQLIQTAGIPIAAPSANIFGHISPTTADHVLDDLDGRIDAVLDAGPTQHGVESTVLDPNQTPMILYRPGAITAEQLRAVAGPVEIFHAPPRDESRPQDALPSPGVGLRHYAPRARLILLEVSLRELAPHVAVQLQQHQAERVGVMLPAEIPAAEITQRFPNAVIFPWGRWALPQELAHALYAGLRTLDAEGCAIILCPLPPADGLGAALHDRLRKAAR